ncbi:hypothetical protein V7Z92_26790 [Priestia megaterium]|uniref:spr1630 family ClpXP-sensitive toxin n=1 Tax=Priestia megaterium TaxID=1404 RepID=UPI001C490E69|nr:hypothetical protein [Priestia megaterium]MBV6738701.1 hypothetical protein [Priestia megaterium]
MDGYKFSEELSQHIVDGILKGYKSYLAERKEKKEQMTISSAYAWVKGNHIEDAVTQECKRTGITYRASKAGYTWGYLQFSNLEDKVLFVIKNGSSIGKRLNTLKNKDNVEQNYLTKLSHINSGINFEKKEKNKVDEEQMTLQLFESFLPSNEQMNVEVEEMNKEFNRFYIISYAIDEAKMISDINLFLPNPETLEILKVDNWNKYMEISNIKLQPEELEIVQNEKEPEQQIVVGDYDIQEVIQERTESDE